MGELKNISLAEIEVSKNNPRKHTDAQKLKDLTDSIKEKGVIEPVIVRKITRGYEVVCGERRVKAAKLAGLEEIPAVIRVLDDRQALEFQIIENLQREDVHPLEEAEGYEQLLKHRVEKKLITIDDLAAKVGKSKAYIYGRLKLCELILENRKYFYDGKFSPSVALLVARVPKDLQKKAGKDIATGEGAYGDGQPLSYNDAKEYIEGNFMLQIKEAKFDIKEKGLAGKVSCAECLKRTSNQKELFNDIKGADRCTDPNCFEAKKQAFIQRQVSELKKSGKKIIPTEETEKALSYGSNYLKLDDTCYHNAFQGKRPTYGELAKKAKDAEIIYAISPNDGRIVALIAKPEAARILKKLGVKDESEDTKTRGEKIGEHKKEERVTSEKHKFFIDKIASNMDQRVKNVFILSALQERAQVEGAPFEDDIKEMYELGDDKVKALIAKALKEMPGFTMYDDQDLDFICKELGFSMAKDYVITKEYLEAMTKSELEKLAKEIGITKALEGKNVDCSDMSSLKKPDIIRLFMDWKELKGKVPKELLK